MPNMTAPSPSQILTRYSYGETRWRRRQEFVERITSLAADRGIVVDWTTPEQWTATLRRDHETALLAGYVFGLNSAVVAKITSDKADTCEVLTAAGVPAVPHFRLHLYTAEGRTRTPAELVDDAVAAAGLPAVIKPNSGTSSGSGISIARTREDVQEQVTAVLSKHGNVAVSPLLEFEEYRTIVLDGEPLLTYRKVRDAGQWMHNLKFGAGAEIIRSGAICDQVQTLAVSALDAIGGRFSSVDTVVCADGRQMVLEFNDGVALGYFLHRVPEGPQIADAVYARVLDSIFP